MPVARRLSGDRTGLTASRVVMVARPCRSPARGASQACGLGACPGLVLAGAVRSEVLASWVPVLPALRPCPAKGKPGTLTIIIVGGGAEGPVRSDLCGQGRAGGVETPPAPEAVPRGGGWRSPCGGLPVGPLRLRGCT